MKVFSASFFSNGAFLSLLLISVNVLGKVSVTVDTVIYKPEVVMDEIKRTMVDPQIIVWYSGESSLVEEGASFYRDEIFSRASSGKFYLYDLVAWEGLRKFKSKITTESKVSQKINELALDKFTAVHSANFLRDLAEEQNAKVLSYYNDVIFKNTALNVNSATRKANKVLVKEKLPGESTKAIHDLDTAYAYSSLQYLEGIFLIKSILRGRQGKTTDIVFLLPNDEYKYYVSPNLEKDLNAILELTMPNDTETRVFFKCFQFGDSTTLRPYIMKGNKVTADTVNTFLK